MKRHLYILPLVLLLCLAGCRVQQQLPPNRNTLQRDSVRTQYVHDSVYVERERIIRTSGDTVYLHDTVTVTRTQRMLVHDSIRVHLTDTIYQYPPATQQDTCDSPFLHKSGIALWVILSLLIVAVIIGIVLHFVRR